MKKNADLKKHLCEGETDSAAGRQIKFLLVLFLILPKIVYSQIPINGFCLYNSYQTETGFNKILPVDLNGDKKDEFILYSNKIKKIGILSIRSNGKVDAKEYPVSFELSQIRYLKDLNRFVCVSRKNRLIAIYEFKLTSSPELKSKINFDSYPENISIADVNNDSKLEILVSGIGFDGLSVMFREKGRIAEKKIISGESFSNAVFVDLSNDGYPDIAAFNLVSGNIQFFYNDTNGRFKLEREIQVSDNIHLLNTWDFDSDGFSDLIYANGKSLNILYGDFQSAYNKNKSLILRNNPSSIQFADFNNDNSVDVAYISLQSEEINILFGRGNREFFEEISYAKLASAVYMQKYFDNRIVNLSALNSEGQVITISSFKHNFDNVGLIPAVKAYALQKFDFDNDGIPDISFIDELENELRVLVRDKFGIPALYYSHQLAGWHRNIFVDDFFKQKKTFYFYSEGQQLIEFVRYNFETNKLSHKQLYSPGTIKDLVLHRSDSSHVYIYLLYEKSSKLYLGRFEHRDQSITFKEFPFIDRNVITAKLLIDQDMLAYYWKASSDSVFFNEVTVKSGPNVYRGIVGFPKGDSIKISLHASNRFYNGKLWLISIIKNDDKYSVISFKEDGYQKLQGINENSELNLFKGEQFSFVQLQNDGNEHFLFYQPDLKALYQLLLSKNGKTYSLKQIAGEIDINNYFIDKFNNTNYHVIFSDKEKGCISVVQLRRL